MEMVPSFYLYFASSRRDAKSSNIVFRVSPKLSSAYDGDVTRSVSMAKVHSHGQSPGNASRQRKREREIERTACLYLPYLLTADRAWAIFIIKPRR